MMELSEGIKVDNVTDKVLPYLKESTIEQMKMDEKPTSTVKFNKDGSINSVCLYYGARAKISKLDDAIKQVCEKINRLGDEGVIKGNLGGVVKYDMQMTDLQEPECLVLCYVFLTPEIHAREQSNKTHHPEELK